MWGMVRNAKRSGFLDGAAMGRKRSTLVSLKSSRTRGPTPRDHADTFALAMGVMSDDHAEAHGIDVGDGGESRMLRAGIFPRGGMETEHAAGSVGRLHSYMARAVSGPERRKIAVPAASASRRWIWKGCGCGLSSGVAVIEDLPYGWRFGSNLSNVIFGRDGQGFISNSNEDSRVLDEHE